MISPYLLIQKKRDGETLTPDLIKTFIAGFTSGEIPDYQMAAFLMAVFFQGMNATETAALTKAMMDSGDTICPEELGSPTADKHSTGGVGDKISIILAPLVASAGVRVPMMSGRGLGHTGGTLDKLESIPGFNTKLNKKEFISQIDNIDVAMIGQTDRMVPADKQMYSLRDVTATVDCIPLIAASIMSKKLAAGPENLVLDIKVGRGAFMKDRESALQLARAMVDIGSEHGRNVQALLTDMNSQPLGRAVGNSLEIMESVEVLQGNGPDDLRDLTIELSAAMLTLTGVDSNIVSAKSRLGKLLYSGKAYEKFLELVEHQGGDPKSVEPPFNLPLSRNTVDVTAENSGIITGINPMTVGLASVELGAGRLKKEDEIDPGVGIWILKRVGDPVTKGESLATLYLRNEPRPELLQRITRSFEIGEDIEEEPNLIFDKVF